MKQNYNDKNYFPEGCVEQEMKQITKIRDEGVYVYSIATNTCTPYLSIICC